MLAKGPAEELEFPTNTGRRRININAAATIALFQQLEAIHGLAVCIYVICDNARYYRSQAIQAYLKTSRIQLMFLPP